MAKDSENVMKNRLPVTKRQENFNIYQAGSTTSENDESFH